MKIAHTVLSHLNFFEGLDEHFLSPPFMTISHIHLISLKFSLAITWTDINKQETFGGIAFGREGHIMSPSYDYVDRWKRLRTWLRNTAPEVIPLGQCQLPSLLSFAISVRNIKKGHHILTNNYQEFSSYSFFLPARSSRYLWFSSIKIWTICHLYSCEVWYTYVHIVKAITMYICNPKPTFFFQTK